MGAIYDLPSEIEEPVIAAYKIIWTEIREYEIIKHSTGTQHLHSSQLLWFLGWRTDTMPFYSKMMIMGLQCDVNSNIRLNHIKILVFESVCVYGQFLYFILG